MIPEVPHKSHFLLGHTKHFASNTLGFVLDCAQKGLTIARAKIAFKVFVILLDNESIRYVLQKNHKNYKKSFAYKGLKDFLGNGLLTAEGDSWLKNRRALQPAFQQNEIKLLEERITDVVLANIQKLPTGEKVTLQTVFLKWTRDIILYSFFDARPEQISNVDKLHEHLWFLRTYANNRMKNPLMLPLWMPTKTNQQFKKSISELEGILLNLFKNTKANDCKLVQYMLEQQLKSDWTDEQVFNEMLTLFLAGQETTTNAMIFLVDVIIKNPASLSKVKDKQNPLEWEHIIKEVLRLYPPAWAVSREAINDDTLSGEKIKKGTTMFLSIYAMHHHPDIWDKAEEFYPERFLGVYPKDSYLPFGLGPRMCIGNHFAIMEMEIMAKQLFDTFSIEKLSREITLITPITMGPKEPYVVKFTKG